MCIDYRRVNQLTRLMVNPMPLISDLVQDMNKSMWYCLLEMESGFWVVEMTAPAREILALIAPLGLFEWLEMPFILKNAPQIYQCLINNAQYRYLKNCTRPTTPPRNHQILAMCLPKLNRILTGRLRSLYEGHTSTIY